MLRPQTPTQNSCRHRRPALHSCRNGPQPWQLQYDAAGTPLHFSRSYECDMAAVSWSLLEAYHSCIWIHLLVVWASGLSNLMAYWVPIKASDSSVPTLCRTLSSGHYLPPSHTHPIGCCCVCRPHDQHAASWILRWLWSRQIVRLRIGAGLTLSNFGYT